MNFQLEQITKLFESNEIKYWIDSGTLLGLMRDGQLIEGDGDIDISMWEEEVENILLLLTEESILENYRHRLLKYNNRIFKIKLISINDGVKEPLTIDINFFRKSEDFAWCPQPYKFINTEKKPIIRILNSVFITLSMKYLKSKAKKIDFYKYPWNKMVMGYWWVPCHMIEKQSKIKDFDVFVPENWKEYLSYRYYDWTKKVDNWKYWCDDGGIVNKSPVSLLQKSR